MSGLNTNTHYTNKPYPQVEEKLQLLLDVKDFYIIQQLDLLKFKHCICSAQKKTEPVIVKLFITKEQLHINNIANKNQQGSWDLLILVL